MKKILIVEDDNFKKETISNLVSTILPSCVIYDSKDISSAIHAISNGVFDLIIIDMSLPSHPGISGGGSPLSLLNGGLEIIFELSSLSRDDKCVIITQYHEIEICGDFYHIAHAAQAIKNNFFSDVVMCLQYVEDTEDWKFGLTKVLREL